MMRTKNARKTVETLVRELSRPEYFENEQASFKWFAAVVRNNLPSTVLLDMSFAIVFDSKAKVKKGHSAKWRGKAGARGSGIGESAGRALQYFNRGNQSLCILRTAEQIDGLRPCLIIIKAHHHDSSFPIPNNHRSSVLNDFADGPG